MREDVDPDLNPADDHTARFLRHLDAYDSTEKPLLSNWPKNLPNKFGLGPGDPRPADFVRVGEVSIDWMRLLDLLLRSAVYQAERSSGIPVDVARSLKDLKERISTGTNSSKEEAAREFNSTFGVLGGIVMYVLEHLPEKFSSALDDLILEARYHSAIAVSAYRGQVLSGSFSEFAGQLAAKEKAAILNRMSERGAKPKSKKGQHSKWTREDFREAMSTAVRAIIDRTRKSSGKLLCTNKNLLQKLTTEIRSLHPNTAPASWDSTRKLIGSLGLAPDWETLKREMDDAGVLRSGK